jgi:hypothetical protein
MEPVSDSVIMAVRAIFSAYAGYSHGKFADTDRGVREEVKRRARMLSNHVTNIHETAHEGRQRKARREAEKVSEICTQLQYDARYSISRSPHTVHEGIGKMNKKSIKKLIDHDLSTLQRLVKCTNKVNEITDAQTNGAEEGDVMVALSELKQMCTGTKNHFLERNMLIDGLTKR